MANLFDSPVASDPAADFLARDREQLASLGLDDSAATSTAIPDFAAPSATTAVFSNGDADGFSFLNDASSAPNPFSATAFSETTYENVTVSDVLDIVEAPSSETIEMRANAQSGLANDFAAFDANSLGGGGFASTGDSFGLGADFAGGSLGEGLGGVAPASSDPMAELRSLDRERGDPEPVRIWREAQKERLAKKDAEEEKRKAEIREQAKREIAEWYRHYEETLKQTQLRNKEAETAYMEEREESAALSASDCSGVGGGAWEHVARLCDFNPKNSKCTKDVTRFRGLLLNLKQPSEAAASVARQAANGERGKNALLAS